MKGYSFRSLTDLVLKIFKTKVNAGTGLSGGGSLEADRTLTVKYGTAAGTAAQGNDSRLSNSREWTATTISQAEAQAGTAKTRRAFTAQRVRQAIVAWWNSITGAFGRDLVTSADNTIARGKLGLSTSALRWPSWAEVTSKPTTFTPSSHTHPWSQVAGQPATATRWPSLSEVTGKPANYPTTWNSVAAKPAQATRWPSFTEVTGKPATYAPSSHTHPVSQVTGLGNAATRNVGVGHGNVMGVGAFGLGGLYVNQNLSNQSYLATYSPTTLPTNYPSGEYGYGAMLSIAHGYSGDNADMVFQHTAKGKILHRNSRNSDWREILHTGNILTTTGQSTLYPMTQKAVTDAINNSAIGVGQTWQNVAGSRTSGTLYTNTQSKAIEVFVVFNDGSGGNHISIAVGGVSLESFDPIYHYNFRSFTVPRGKTYKVTYGRNPRVRWMELR